MTILEAFAATWRRVLGDRTLLSTMLLAVVLYTFYYPAPYSHQVAQRLPVIVVDEENSGASRAILRDIETTRGVEIVGAALDVGQARARMQRGEADGIILLSRGLVRTLRTGAPGGGVAIWVNAMYSLRASTIETAVENVLRAQPGSMLGLQAGSPNSVGPPVAVTVEPLFNRTAGYKGYIFPAVAVIIAQQTLLFGSAMFVAGSGGRRRRPMGSATFLGRWAALTSIGSLGTLFLFGLGFWLQDVPRGGNAGALTVAVPLFAAAVAALGLICGSFVDRPERAMALLAPTSVPFFFLTGSAWPLDQMPEPIALLAHLLPSTSGVHLFVGLNQMDASLAETGRDLATVALLAAAYGALGWARLTRGSPSDAELAPGADPPGPVVGRLAGKT